MIRCNSFTVPTWSVAAASLLMWWMSLPPLYAVPLVVGVPLCWTLIVRASDFSWRDVFWLWLGAFLFWLANIYWIGYPHPANIFGLVAGAAYLACYLPLAIVVTRRAVYCFAFPCWVSLPLVWCGCEWLRAHLFGGFSFAALEHALAPFPILIQTADIGGGYLVGMMVVLLGSALAEITITPRRVAPFIFAGVVVTAALVYGTVRVWQYDVYSSDPSLVKIKVAAIQGNSPCALNPPTEDYYLAPFEKMTRLAQSAAAAGANLVVLPETICPLSLVTFTSNASGEHNTQARELEATFRDRIFEWGCFVGTPTLVGLTTYIVEAPDIERRYNSALLIDPESGSFQQYDKHHLVMFGEYVPLLAWLPAGFRQSLHSLCQEATPGTAFVPMQCGPLTLAVNICYESTVPHFIRQQVWALTASRGDVALLVNMSNDGWFLGSVQQDFHLITHRFRAVEHRKEYISSTNGGYAAAIDAVGRLRGCGARNTADVVVAEVPTRSVLSSLYTVWGDTLATACFIATLFLALPRRWFRRRVRRVAA